MRTGGSLLVALLLAAPAVGQAGATKVTNYFFMISLPDSGTEIRGKASIDLGARVVGGPHDTLRLHFVGMTVDAVATPLGPLPFRADSAGIVVALPENVVTFSRGDVVGLASITVEYHGTPRDGLIIGANARGARVVFGDNWPERARNWLPVVDRPGAKATVSFSVEAPGGLHVVAPGKAVYRRPTDGGRVRWVWQERHPIPTYTMVIGAGKFTVSKHRPVINGRDTIPIEVWTYPEDSAYADSVPFRRATEIVEVMQRLIGPYPYENLKHVQSSTRFGGMENASAIFYAEKPYVERRMGEGVVRHETAHQWFGDAVTPRDWPHLWLSEGFATYFDAVIGAALDGDTVL
ncbi:MAG TPA: M1 family aminopeptidase, partial [Gemmatimonadales bacterium]|nr:M1 family aminopeptidase [Gemmatimonadales bacterium]